MLSRTVARWQVVACFAGSAICTTAAILFFAKGEERVVATPTTVEVGRVLSGARVTVEFNVANNTSKTVKFAETFKQCDCTNVHCDRAALKPGEIAHCSIDWNTTGRSGPASTLIGQTWRIDGKDVAWLCKVTANCRVSTDSAWLAAGATLRGAGPRHARVPLHSSLQRAEVMRLSASTPQLLAELEAAPGGLQAKISTKSKSLPAGASLILEVRDKNSIVKYELPVDVLPGG